MTAKQFRKPLSAWLPRVIQPRAMRLMRLCRQLFGAPRSHRRPGVVAMFHVGRCGSSVLAELLAQDASMYWDAKLHRKAKFLYGERFKVMDQRRWLKRQFRQSGSQYYGFEFKCLDNQYPAIAGITLGQFLDDCRAIGVTHYILLVRRNTLRHVVSHYLSIQRGSWHLAKGRKAEQVTVDLDLDNITTGSGAGCDIVDYFEQVDAAHNLVRQRIAPEHLLELSYEVDIDQEGPAFAYARISDFLGVGCSSVSIEHVKTNPLSIKQAVRNYDDLARRLERSRFAWMLEG